MSDSPEEPPNTTGVLGRLGSWLWARTSTNSSENASPTIPDPDRPTEEPLVEDVFYPVSQQDSFPSGEEDEWEEASSFLESGPPTQPHSTSHRAQTQLHSSPCLAHTGKKLHVYVEETSVFGDSGKEVTCKYAKSLQVRPKSRSSVSLDSEKGQSYSSALVGVSLNTQKGEPLEAEDAEMGRKNARKKNRKNSQGDSTERKELTDRDKDKPKPTAAGPASQTPPAPSPALPKQAESGSSGPADVKSGQDNNSSSSASEAASVERESMEGDDSLYRVERKTETPESKRRSMKVSKSQVKLFTKNVPLPNREKQGGKADLNVVVTREEIREEAAAQDKLKEAKKPEDQPKPTTGRITDKISLFENTKRLFDTPRSTDVSPVRKPPGRLKTEQALPERSRSDDCLDKQRSSSTSPPRQKGMTIKERVKHFNDVCTTGTPSGPKQNISKIHHKITASKSLENLDLPDRPDVNEKPLSKAALQLKGADDEASAGNLKTESQEQRKKEETNTGETNDANDSNKVPTRTGSKNKKRRSKEPAISKSKHDLDMVDGKLTDQDDKAGDSASKKSQEAADSGKVQHPVTKKVEEKVVKSQSTNKTSEKTSKEGKLSGSNAQEDGQEKDVKKHSDETIPGSSIKPPREDKGNKVDSSKGQDEVKGLGPQQSLDDKESKTLPTPEVKDVDLSIKSSTGEHAEKLSSRTGKKSVKPSNDQFDLHNKEGTVTQKKEAVSAVQESKESSLKNKSKASTVKQKKSIVEQKAVAQGDNSQLPDTTAELDRAKGNEHNLPSVKQAASSAIDKAEPHSAEELSKVASTTDKIEENKAQETPRGSKQEAPSSKLENAATRTEQKPSNKVNGATMGNDKKLSIEVTKSIPSNENKIDLAITGQLKPDDKIGTKAIDKPEQTKEITDKNKVDLSNSKNESDSGSEVPKNIDKKDAATLAKSKKSTIQESTLQIAKDVARQDGTEEKTAHLSVSKVETDTSASSDGTKAPIDKIQATLPQKDQKITGQNGALFKGGTDGLDKDEKERLADSDLPAAARNANKSRAGLEGELMASKLQSKQDAEAVGTGPVKQGVTEKGETLVKNVAGEKGTFVKQGLNYDGAKLEKEGNVASHKEKSLQNSEAEKQEKSSKISPNDSSSAVESVGAENKAFSVEDNEGERAGRTHTLVSPPSALTNSTKIHGKETQPKSAVAPEPQAECITAEKNSQNQPDDSAQPVTANPGTLTVSKNDIPEQKVVVENTNKTEEGEKARTNIDGKAGSGKMSPESSQMAKDLIKQASTEFEKAITNVVSGKTAPTNEIVVNGDVTVLPKGTALKDKTVTANKQSLKTSPDANKFLDSSRKRHNMAKGRSKDDWSLTQQQDAPSSWLDVDFPKQKLKVPTEAKLTYSGSESNLLDSSADLDDEDFVEKIKKLCAPFQLPPRKHNHLRPPQPPFAMPAIREARVEKTFDPEEFTFGLRKKKFETPNFKLQSSEEKTSIKPARASLADRSMLLSGKSRFQNKTNDEEEPEDEAKDEIKVKSRLEGSCVLSSLTTSNFRSKFSQSPAQGESTDSGNVSPSNSPQQQSPQQPGPPPLSPTKTNPETSLQKEEMQSAEELVVTDSGPPLPTFDNIKLPSFLEKFLPREAKAEAQKEPGREQRVGTDSTQTGPKMPSVKEETQNNPDEQQVETEKPTVKESEQKFPEVQQVDNKVKMPSVVSPTVEMNVKGGVKLPESVTNHYAGISLKDKATPPPAQPRRRPSKKIRAAKGFHRRPGKMLLFEKAPFEGQLYEVNRDMEDATSLLLSPLISVRVVRGCWVLYEKPGFQGRTIALEEGSLELSNVWAEPGPDPDTPSDTPMQIGSIRLAVADYSVPHIDLFTEPEGRGRVTGYHDDTLETGSFGIPLSTASIQVHSGVWLVFSDPGYQGMLAVLETGVYPFPETWGFPSPFVGSLRPLKMGGFKVENPNEIKAVLYEKAGLEGPGLVVEADVFSFGEEGDEVDSDPSRPQAVDSDPSRLQAVDSDPSRPQAVDSDPSRLKAVDSDPSRLKAVDSDPSRLKAVGSLKVHGGLWVGYSEPGFEGQQYILEEGEYLSCGDWGGTEILSLRPIMTDFMTPHLKMFSDRDFGKLGVNIDLTVPVINLDETGYGLKTQSIDVLSGVWVVFEEAGFSGESYVVERGQYGSPEDWGATKPSIASAMPVLLENFENTAKFKVQLFSEAHHRGSSLILEDSEASLPAGFSVASCKVLAGSWLAFEGKDFSGRMYVLDEGSYPDLRAMGCVNSSASILSLQIVGFEFSMPSIVLFERSGLKGKRVVLNSGAVNLQLSGAGGRVQSLLVEGGLWVLYEEINYRGAQVLLRPGEVSDWRSICQWKKIGSLRPLLQKQVHFHLRNSLSGQLMTVTGDLDDIKLLRVQEMEETQGFEQIWFFQNGQLRCKLLEECCLCPSSSVTIAGARVGLTPALDEDSHLWSITPQGFICYGGGTNLVLEVKGGHNYDKSQVVLNTRDPNKPQQQWLVQVL